MQMGTCGWDKIHSTVLHTQIQKMKQKSWQQTPETRIR